MKWILFLPSMLAMMTSAIARSDAPDTSWKWTCQMMAPSGPEISKTGQLQINFDRTADIVSIEIVSKDFPQLVAERQARVAGPVTEGEVDIDGKPVGTAWLVETASGRRNIEVISHSSRNGSGTAILISSYKMTTIGGLPEDFFAYHAVGLCR